MLGVGDGSWGWAFSASRLTFGVRRLAFNASRLAFGVRRLAFGVKSSSLVRSLGLRRIAQTRGLTLNAEL